jgi:hypothetical protein
MNEQTGHRMITSHDLAQIGAPNLVYVKRRQLEEQQLFAVHAADGTELLLADSRDIAFAAARQQGLAPVDVQ